MTIRSSSPTSPLGPSLVVASVLALLPVWAIFAVMALGGVEQQDAERRAADTAAAVGVLLLGVFATWVLAISALWLLTAIERRGLAVIGRVHGWRITRAVTGTVCAYASYGWVLAGALFGCALAAGVAMEIAQWPSWPLRPSLSLGLIAGAALAGLLIFETLVYIGVRRCKFANRARPPGAGPSHGGTGAETVAPATQPPA